MSLKGYLNEPMNAVEYAVDGGSRILVRTSWTLLDRNAEYIAEDCAEDYHYNHLGWERHSWPVEITFWAEDRCWGTFIVEREAVPQFSADRKEEEVPDEPDQA